MQISFKSVTSFLDLCASSLCRNDADLLCIPLVEEKLDYTAGLLREIRTFGRAVEGSHVSPLTDTMGGLSGGGRGGDTSEAAPSPSFVGARPRPDSWPLFLPPVLAALPSS